MNLHADYDVVVVGGGHAGCEAAAAAANMGSSVLLITMNMQTIAQMSCNPAMGVIAKGQIVREIDALGGYSGIVSDRSAIQFRMLNRSKGPAMWSPRTQNDRSLFSLEWRKLLENIKKVDFIQDTVNSLIISKDNVVEGVNIGMGVCIYSNAVIITSGTFLNGIIHIGESNFSGGRAGEGASLGLTEQLNQLGFVSGRMKTGTPPRVDGRSLNYSVMEEQKGDEKPCKFSYSDTLPLSYQRSCYMTYTNDKVHNILKKGFEFSPMFQGRIKGIGPRYCPSIEDKLTRFADKDRHQIFVEPEGWNTVEVYVNGFSTSLPAAVQLEGLRNIQGFENVKVFRPGYAIEYDYFPPTQLDLTLQTKVVKNLYFAGQINGTTGYEEAACQGLMAGINAHLSINEKDPFVLKRSEAYIGVLIDDLVTKGTDEPYRMFTSRAEYRILLRQDNADLRLTAKGFELGLASMARFEECETKREQTNDLVSFLKKNSIQPSDINSILEESGTDKISQKASMFSILSRPQIGINNLLKIPALGQFLLKNNIDSEEVLLQAEIQIKYEGYIGKEREIVDKFVRYEQIKLYPDFEYKRLTSLSIEAREKLSKAKPGTIGQASRISGVSPSDISILLVYLGK